MVTYIVHACCIKRDVIVYIPFCGTGLWRAARIPKISYPFTTTDPPLSAWPPSGYHQRPLNGGYIDCSIEAHNNLASSLIETLLYFWGQWGHYYWIGLLSSAILFCNYFWTLINGGLIESSTAVISGNQSNEQLLSYSKPSCFS